MIQKSLDWVANLAPPHSCRPIASFIQIERLQLRRYKEVPLSLHPFVGSITQLVGHLAKVGCTMPATAALVGGSLGLFVQFYSNAVSRSTDRLKSKSVRLVQLTICQTL